MKKLILRIIGYFKRKYLPISGQEVNFSKTRQIDTQQSRQIKKAILDSSVTFGGETRSNNIISAHSGQIASAVGFESSPRNDNATSQEFALICPYCSSKDTVKSGLRKKKYEPQHFATRIANMALQAVNDNKLRHKALQRFMICNDSVTVATEVPVYMDEMDIEHMNESLGFNIPIKLDKVLTGRIDMLQIRNGSVHILDYKPAKSAKRDKPVTQLTLYALALSRLTGLRLYDFKCAWFDENAYFEFFPLHVVYKLRDRQKKEDPKQMKWDTLVDSVVEKKH